MPAFRAVFCATDLSADEDETIAQGDALAKLHQARLIVFHAIAHGLQSAPLFPQAALADNRAFVALERRVLEAVAARTCAVTGRAATDFEVQVGFGSAHSAIVEHAERLKADVIVVGGRGASPAIRAVLGAVAERVVRHAHCAVWVARPGPRAGPVLIASDFSDPSFPAVEAGVEHARRCGAAVVAVHALSLADPARGGDPSDAAWQVWSPQELQQLRDDAAAKLTTALTRFGAAGEAVVDDRFPAEAILDEAHERKARVICLATRGRTGLPRVLLGSVAEDVVRRAACSVLAVRLHPHR